MIQFPCAVFKESHLFFSLLSSFCGRVMMQQASHPTCVVVSTDQIGSKDHTVLYTQIYCFALRPIDRCRSESSRQFTDLEWGVQETFRTVLICWRVTRSLEIIMATNTIIWGTCDSVSTSTVGGPFCYKHRLWTKDLLKLTSINECKSVEWMKETNFVHVWTTCGGDLKNKDR